MPCWPACAVRRGSCSQDKASSPWMWTSYQPCTAACKMACSAVASPDLTASTAAVTMTLRTGEPGSGNGGDGT